MTEERALRRAVFLRWRRAWDGLTPGFRFFWVATVGVSAVATLTLGGGFGSAAARLRISNLGYVVVPVTAGLLLISAALRQRGPGWRGWLLIGAGVALWGVGELIWLYY